MSNPHLALTLTLSLIAAAGCRRGRREGGRQGAQAQRLEPDKRFSSPAPVAVWEIPVRHSLVHAGREISGQESAAARRQRQVWRQRSTFHSRLLLHPERLVWLLPSRALPGGAQEALRLVIKPRANVVALVSDKRKSYRADTPARVAAWIEGSVKPAAILERLEVLSQGSQGPRSGTSGPGVRHTVHGLQGLLVPRTAPRSPPEPRYNLRSRAVDAAAYGGPGQGQSLLWDFALAPLLGTTSGASLAALRGKQRWPLQVDLCLARSTSGESPWLRVTFGLTERRRRHVSPRQLRLPPGPGFQRKFGPLTYAKGRQLQRRVLTAAIKRKKGDPRRAGLVVHNPTRRALYVYADGVLLGWVGPRKTYTLNTAESGYYRITAQSLLGTTSFGPRDLYVPGEIRLGKR